MQQVYIKYTLEMRTPAPEFKKIGFQPLIEDNKEAVKEFNKYYKENEKKLIFPGVDHRGCHLMLITDPNVKISLNVKDLLIFCNKRAICPIFPLAVKNRAYKLLHLQALTLKFGAPSRI